MEKITKNDVRFNDLEWVLRAKAKKHESFPVFNFLYSKDSEIVCTDGKRLHLSKTVFPEGLWEIVKSTKSEIWMEKNTDDLINFPDYNKIIPGKDTEIKIEMNGDTDTNFFKIAKVMEKNTISYQYLDDITRGQYDLICFFDNDDKALTFKNETKIALLMPKRIDK